MLDTHLEAAPRSAYAGTEEVGQRRLDDVVPVHDKQGDRIFLKADVQGYERAVLDGAERLLRSERIVGLQMEMSFVPLYGGSITWQEVISRAEALGMEVMYLLPGFTSREGRMLQADGVFFRS